MNDERIDFTPLDPHRDPERFEARVGAILAAATTRLAARRTRDTVLGQLAVWWRPLLAAAAIAGIVSALTLAGNQAPSTAIDDELGVAEAIGVPVQIAQWVRSDVTPGPTELLAILETGQ
jgi:hypothetical protein